MSEKPWYESSGVWGCLGAVVTSLTLLSATLIGIYTGQVQADDAQIGLQIGALITSVVGLRGRIVATKRIRI